jgi:hypothetical protein
VKEINKEFIVGRLVEFCLDPRYITYKKDGLDSTLEKHLGVLLSEPDSVGYVKVQPSPRYSRWGNGDVEVHMKFCKIINNEYPE